MSISLSEAMRAPLAAPNLKLLEIPELKLESAQVLLKYYQEMVKNNEMPLKSQIDPVDIPLEVLASVYLLEPMEDYSDWVYRLIGTRITTSFRVDRTGQSFHSFLPKDHALELVECSNQVVKRGQPVFFSLTAGDTAMEPYYAETMSLPVNDAKTGKIWLFGGTFFQRHISEYP